MAQTVSLSATPRQATGKGAARQARFRGRVPAVIYGHGRDTQPLELEAKALEKALQGVEPASTIIDLAVDGKTVKTLIREIQRHPIRPDIIHVDFYEIHATEKVKLKVPVHLELDLLRGVEDRKSTRLNSSHDQISYAVFCLKKK